MERIKKDVLVQTKIDPYTKELLQVVEKATGLVTGSIVRMALTMYLNNWFELNDKKLPKVK